MGFIPSRSSTTGRFEPSPKKSKLDNPDATTSEGVPSLGSPVSSNGGGSCSSTNRPIYLGGIIIGYEVPPALMKPRRKKKIRTPSKRKDNGNEKSPSVEAKNAKERNVETVVVVMKSSLAKDAVMQEKINDKPGGDNPNLETDFFERLGLRRKVAAVQDETTMTVDTVNEEKLEDPSTNSDSTNDMVCQPVVPKMEVKTEVNTMTEEVSQALDDALANNDVASRLILLRENLELTDLSLALVETSFKVEPSEDGNHNDDTTLLLPPQQIEEDIRKPEEVKTSSSSSVSPSKMKMTNEEWMWFIDDDEYEKNIKNSSKHLTTPEKAAPVSSPKKKLGRRRTASGIHPIFEDPVKGTLCNICGELDTSRKELHSFLFEIKAVNRFKPFLCITCNQRFASGELTKHKTECFLTYDDCGLGYDVEYFIRKFRMMACDTCADLCKVL